MINRKETGQQVVIYHVQEIAHTKAAAFILRSPAHHQTKS